MVCSAVVGSVPASASPACWAIWVEIAGVSQVGGASGVQHAAQRPGQVGVGHVAVQVVLEGQHVVLDPPRDP